MCLLKICLVLFFGQSVIGAQKNGDENPFVIYAVDGSEPKASTTTEQKGMRRSIPPQAFPPNGLNGLNGLGLNGLNGFNGFNGFNGLNGFNGFSRLNGLNGFPGANFQNGNYAGVGMMGLNPVLNTYNPNFRYPMFSNNFGTNFQPWNSLSSIYNPGSSTINPGLWNTPYNTYPTNIRLNNPYLFGGADPLVASNHFFNSGQLLTGQPSFSLGKQAQVFGRSSLNSTGFIKRSPMLDPQSPYYIRLYPGETYTSETDPDDAASSFGKRRNTSPRSSFPNHSQFQSSSNSADSFSTD